MKATDGIDLANLKAEQAVMRKLRLESSAATILTGSRGGGKTTELAARTEAFNAGWNAALCSIKASLEGYPHAGGDIEIMAEVERIVKAEMERTVCRICGQTTSCKCA